MCTNALFSEDGMIGLLEQAVELFREVLNIKFGIGICGLQQKCYYDSSS